MSYHGFLRVGAAVPSLRVGDCASIAELNVKAEAITAPAVNRTLPRFIAISFS